MKNDAAYLSLLKPWPYKITSPLSVHLKSAFPFIPAEATTYIDRHCYTLELKKNKRLLKAGQLCDYLFFVQKGVLRSYVKQGNTEITTWIVEENDFVTSIRGFHLQTPTAESIAAIEDCELVAIEYDSLQYLYNNFNEMNTIGRKILEKYYIEADERAFISRLNKAAAKYDHFLATRDNLVNRIPLKYIASYLNMTIETLSRMRSQITKK